MGEAIDLIDKIIKEHQVVFKRFNGLEKVLSDVKAIASMEEAKEAFVPGRFDQKESLKELKESLESIDEGLQAHFNREETALLSAFEKHGDRKLVSALHSLLLEHKDLRDRFSHSKKHVSELMGGGLARHKWEASAHDMRAHLTHTRKLLEAHAGAELPLLMTLRKKLQVEAK
jgi:hypothetical protein